MTDREKNIAIAEWCGWRIVRVSHGALVHWSSKEWRGPNNEFRVPDYCGDLNAIHDVELKLPPNNSMHGRIVFDNILMTICGSHQACVSSTAAQRAEALLKTIGKWKE